MNLGEFREHAKYFSDDYDVVISGKNINHKYGRAGVFGVISCRNISQSTHNCLIVLEDSDKSFLDLLLDIKNIIYNYIYDKKMRK